MSDNHFNSLDLLFIGLTAIVAVHIALIFLNKEYNKVSIFYSFSLLTIFYMPSLYYYAGGDAYKFFLDESLMLFMGYATVIFSIYISLSLILNNLNVPKKNLILINNSFVKLYFIIFLCVILIYYIIFFNRMPIYHIFLGDEVFGRPDVSGGIPLYFTFSSLGLMVLPSIYFFYFEDVDSKIKHFIINVLLIFFLIIGGNKGFLVYYFIFLWLFVLGKKINLKVLLLFFVAFAVYILFKGITEYNQDTLSYMLSSPFRRFFVTQGVGHIIRFDMISEGYDYLQSNPRGIKFDVFGRMYNTNIVGSAPTFYTGDISVRYGVIASLITFFIITSIVVTFSQFIFKSVSNKKLFVLWGMFTAIYVITMAEISLTNSLRVLISFLNILVVFFLSRIGVLKRKR